ncbi:OmpH family outer membrane protein [Apibacter raozihei]|uniref:OmpH family outer membrane protein n=1 Tax=Apibacter raozihei TaxID=2500547 RepID=UPI000FE42B06|nr:OmpH family outer membrane protein [Apibacter raozihei]
MKKITFVFLLTVFAGVFQLAKAQNIAHLNSIELLNLMPEKKSADDQLKTLADQKKAELKKQEDAFTAKYQKIQDEIAKKPQAEQEKEFQKYQEEFQKDNQNLLALRETAAKELEKKQDDLYDPITKKAQNAVNDVAKAKGYLYVFDTSQPSLIYAAGPNILDEVKAKLGLK